MKTKIVLITLIFLIGAMIPKAFTQEEVEAATSKKIDEKKRIVYWFNITLDIRKHKKYGTKYYVAKSADSRIYNGTLKKYDKILWRQLSTGSRFAVGPFYDWEEANQAREFYKRRINVYRDDIAERQDSIFNRKIANDKRYDKNGLFWFYLSVEIRPRSHSMDIQRIPAPVRQTTYDGFIDNYRVGLMQEKLAIGPFWSHPETEEAKRRYRLH